MRYLCNDKRVSSTVRFDDEEWQLMMMVSLLLKRLIAAMMRAMGMVRTTIKSMTRDKTTMRCIGKSLNEFQSNVNDRPTTLDETW